jgi:hypothetical protein
VSPGVGLADASQIGPPTDVLALGLSLGEALAGRPLFRPLDQELLPLPGAVGALLDEALAPAPGDRPTAAELASALADLAEPPALELAA